MSGSSQGSALLKLITEISISNLSLTHIHTHSQLFAFIPINRAGTILGAIILSWL